MNENLKKYAKGKKIKLWEIADALGIADTTFSKRLRYPLTEDMEKLIYEIIDRQVSRRENND